MCPQVQWVRPRRRVTDVCRVARDVTECSNRAAATRRASRDINHARRLSHTLPSFCRSHYGQYTLRLRYCYRLLGYFSLAFCFYFPIVTFEIWNLAAIIVTQMWASLTHFLLPSISYTTLMKKYTIQKPSTYCNNFNQMIVRSNIIN